MTGIERLRKLSETEMSLGYAGASNTLKSIADQIEREEGEAAADHAVVASVITDMERHVLGHEGMDDSPVARWARELRAALGIDLDKGWSDAMVAMRRRLMPEGMEDMIASYPRFEDGTPALPGMEAVANSGQRSGEAFTIKKAWLENGTWHLSDSTSDGRYWHFKHNNPVVKRPAPKVLDADGAEIRVGDTVWTTRDLDKFTVTNPNNGKFLSVSCKGEDGEDYCCYPTDLTHRAPVLAADGKPLREGETVWFTDNGENKLTVTKIVMLKDGASVYVRDETDDDEYVGVSPSQLTHERPAVDTWERLEEDAKNENPVLYCKKRGIDCEDMPPVQAIRVDLVRRAKALAERDA